MTVLSNKKMVISHRGLNRQAPENTMAAFELAADAGINWLETDVDILGDGTPVILHDTDLDRTTNRTGSMYNIGAEELPQVDAGSWFSPAFSECRLPTLPQLIDFCNERQIDLNLEIKPHLAGEKGANQLVETVARELERLSPDRNLIVSSFSQLQLRKFHEIAPQYVTAPIFNRGNLSEDWFTIAQMCGASYLHLEDISVTQHVVDLAAKSGLGINVWTVNSPARANQLFNWGCTGIFTDIADQIPVPAS